VFLPGLRRRDDSFDSADEDTGDDEVPAAATTTAQDPMPLARCCHFAA